MPVMLSYFEGNELKPVQEDYPDYDFLLSHVASQMDSNDFQLYKTPVVLTLQGDFEDEDLNETIPGQSMWVNDEDYNDEDFEDEDEEDDGEEITVEELLEIENFDEDLDDCIIDDDDEEEEEEESDSSDYDVEFGKEGNQNENENMGSFWTSPASGKLSEELSGLPDYELIRPKVSGNLAIPPDATISDEDTKLLKIAHIRADRIMNYAADVTLIASFHFKKKNYHLVKLLEPIFVIGKRITDIKGYYFNLLSEEEAERVNPIIEDLMMRQRNDEKYAVSPLEDGKSMSVGNLGDSQASSSRKTKRKWVDRVKDRRKQS